MKRKKYCTYCDQPIYKENLCEFHYEEVHEDDYDKWQANNPD